MLRDKGYQASETGVKRLEIRVAELGLWVGSFDFPDRSFGLVDWWVGLEPALGD